MHFNLGSLPLAETVDALASNTPFRLNLGGVALTFFLIGALGKCFFSGHGSGRTSATARPTRQ